MKYVKNIYVVSLFLLLLANPGLGNNITIANQDFGAQDTNAHSRIVQFDISWENSWRDNENHDAAWVFLKYSIDGGITWHHGTLIATPAGYGSGTGLDIIVPSDKKGAYLHRTLLGEGTVDTDGIQLAWDYGADLGADAAGDCLAAFATVRVMATEMVYISEGPFYLGDFINNYTYYPTGTPRDADNAQGLGNADIQLINQGSIHVRATGIHALRIFCQVNWGATTGPYDDCPDNISYAGLLTYCWNGKPEGNTIGAPGSCTGIWFHGDSGISIDQPTESNMNTNWPTGFKAFYYARYEVSQAQYRDFLNTMSTTQAFCHFPDYNSAVRFGIKSDNASYGCDLNNNGIFNEANDGECVPASYCSANDSLAMNDWAALRLPTEWEYEKAGRGTNAPVQKEAANAFNTSLGQTIPSGYACSGMCSEAPSNNTSSGAWIVYHVTSKGPLRSGACATSTSDRKKSGAGYYGVMDLCGNIMEDTISMGTIKGRSYTAFNGDGELDAAGYHNVAGWPGGSNAACLTDVSYTKIDLSERAIARRGGDWSSQFDSQRGAIRIFLSSRERLTETVGYNQRANTVAQPHGLRGARSAE